MPLRMGGRLVGWVGMIEGGEGVNIGPGIVG